MTRDITARPRVDPDGRTAAEGITVAEGVTTVAADPVQEATAAAMVEAEAEAADITKEVGTTREVTAVEGGIKEASTEDITLEAVVEASAVECHRRLSCCS